MYKHSYFLFCIVALVFPINARPTVDVLYKLAQDIEQELLDDSQSPLQDPYRNRNPGYGYGPVPPPHSVAYPVYSSRTHPTYPGQYPPEYSPNQYPSPVGIPPGAPYPAPYSPYGSYPQTYPTNYIQVERNLYDYPTPDQYGNNGYGHVSGSNSYAYGSKSGYRNMGY